MTGDLASAEDLVQSAMVKVWRHWGRVLRADQPESYAHRIVLNEFLGSRRRRWIGEIASGELPDLAAADPALLAMEDRLHLQRALSALPRGQRAVLVLRYLDDLSEAQTAELLGVTVGTVKSQTARALSGLRLFLTNEIRQEIP
jgi:RNA polymerase sigma-70 factor (sigma-E family)